MRIVCAWCGKRSEKPAGAVNRARNAGAPLYCNRICAGLGRRWPPKTAAQKREEKRLYDLEYRATSPTLKARRHEHHLRTYDPAAAAVKRKARMPWHVAYLRRRMADPEYAAERKEYWRKRDAERNYGPAAEAFLALRDLEHEIKERANAYEIRQASGTGNKRQNRQRAAARLVSGRP
jgi:hypothetical protein